MKQRLLSTDLAQYVRADWNGINESGYEAIGDRVIILPDQAAAQTMGNVHLTDEFVEQNTYAAETGVIVAMGGDAFLWNSDRTRKWESNKPGVGTRVFYERYAGGIVKGSDGKLYRVMDDKCVAAVATDQQEHGGAVPAPDGGGASC